MKQFHQLNTNWNELLASDCIQNATARKFQQWQHFNIGVIRRTKFEPWNQYFGIKIGIVLVRPNTAVSKRIYFITSNLSGNEVNVFVYVLNFFHSEIVNPINRYIRGVTGISNEFPWVVARCMRYPRLSRHV